MARPLVPPPAASARAPRVMAALGRLLQDNSPPAVSGEAPPPQGVAAATPQAARLPPFTLPTEGQTSSPHGQNPNRPPARYALVAALHPARVAYTLSGEPHCVGPVWLRCAEPPPPLVAHARDAAGVIQSGLVVAAPGVEPHPRHPGRRRCRGAAGAAPPLVAPVGAASPRSATPGGPRRWRAVVWQRAVTPTGLRGGGGRVSTTWPSAGAQRRRRVATCQWQPVGPAAVGVALGGGTTLWAVV